MTRPERHLARASRGVAVTGPLVATSPRPPAAAEAVTLDSIAAAVR